MLTVKTPPLWKKRAEEIEPEFDALHFPDLASDVDQDAEWCEVVVKGSRRRIRLHDGS